MFTRLVLKPQENTQHLVAVFERQDVTEALWRRNILTPTAPKEDFEIETVINLMIENPSNLPQTEAIFSQEWLLTRGTIDDAEHVATVVDAAIALARMHDLKIKD